MKDLKPQVKLAFMKARHLSTVKKMLLSDNPALSKLTPDELNNLVVEKYKALKEEFENSK